MINERDVYFDKAGKPFFPVGFDIKKAERIMDNFITYHRNMHTTFAEVVSFLILRGTGYDGGTSSNHLCFLFGVDGGDRATFKNWQSRKKEW